MQDVCNTFDQRVAELAKQNLDISAAVDVLNELWEEEEGYCGKHINFGDCEAFAWALCELVPGAEDLWGDELIQEGDDRDFYAYHCFVRYQDRYYDSEHPEGVDDFKHLASFTENRGRG